MPEPMPIFDVVIVGGGLAGMSLALALARIELSDKHSPLRIAIVETKPLSDLTTHNDDARTLVLSHGAARIYQALDIYANMADKAYPLHDIHVSEQGSFGAVRFNAKEQKVAALGYVLPLVALQTQLVTALKDCANITWFCPDTVLQLQKKETYRMLQLQKAGDIKAKLVVAADGAQSGIRELLQIKTHTKTYPEQALVTQVDASSLNHTAYERFSARGTMALLPISSKRASLVWTGTVDQIAKWQALEAPAFLALLQKTFGYRVGRFSGLGRRRVYPLQLIQAAQSVCDRVVLIGHAAHTIHPIAAQGFNLSLRDIAMLAQVIEEALLAGQSIAEPAVLNAYAQYRQRDQRDTVGLTDWLASVFQYDLLGFRLARSMGLLCCNAFFPLKNRLAAHTMGIAGRLPILACRH